MKPASRRHQVPLGFIPNKRSIFGFILCGPKKFINKVINDPRVAFNTLVIHAVEAA